MTKNMDIGSVNRAVTQFSLHYQGIPVGGINLS